jgi:hypothetical protein
MSKRQFLFPYFNSISIQDLIPSPIPIPSPSPIPIAMPVQIPTPTPTLTPQFLPSSADAVEAGLGWAR